MMNKLCSVLSKWDIDIDDKRLELFDSYCELLLSWNEKINLTTITDREDICIKHFADSLALAYYIDLTGKTIIDVGTGAGFPGIPIAVMCPSCNIVLLDSLNKRIDFLNEVIKKLDLNNVCTIHGRAEDTAHDDSYREKFDFAVSRAVANLSVLSEYCIPFVKEKGYFVSYKSGNIDEEIESSGNAVSTLGGFMERVEKYRIPDTDYDRSLVFISKSDHTDNKYPRKAGTPTKKPL